ncbi:MAG: hypothetical protein V2J55_02805 [Candidatus Competibacteraceae bacterium]|jgi:hypothetical protein|nr:hypothetical protein [Candidatus Competibacteraceae bacterium]
MSFSLRIGLIALFLFGFILAVLYPRLPVWHEDTALEPAMILRGEPNCDPVQGPCIAYGEGISLSLSLQGPVRVLTPFPVTLQLDSPEAVPPIRGIAVTFSMVGMSMGFNRFNLEQRNPQTWQGQAMLPVCSLGRTDWRIAVEVTGDPPYEAEFFTVVNR